LLENIQLLDSPSFIKEFPKTQFYWTGGTLAFPLKSTATSNSESMHQHSTTIEGNPPIVQDTINQDENFLKSLGVSLMTLW